MSRKLILLCIIGMTSNLYSKENYPFLGEIQSVKVRLSNGNDNFLNGVFQYSEDLSKYDGDDMGRTFGLGLRLDLAGTGGSLSLQADSYVLSKLAQKDGAEKNIYGQSYLSFTEVNSVGARIDSIFSRSSSPKKQLVNYLISSLNFEESTENGKFSKKIQHWWHEQFKDVIQYDLIKNNEEVKTMSLMGGMGNEWVQCLEKWRFSLRNEIQLGVSRSITSSDSSSRMELGFLTSLDVSFFKLPWMSPSSSFRGLL